MEDERNALDDKLKKMEKDREELWERAKNSQKESERVDELMHENDNLLKELED